MARQIVQHAALGVVQRLSLAHETKGAQILGVDCGDGYENRKRRRGSRLPLSREVGFAAAEDHDSAPLCGKHARRAVREASQEFWQVARSGGVNSQLHQFFGMVAVTWRSLSSSAAARESWR